MTNFVKMLIIPIFALSFACGGQIDDSASQEDMKAPLNFEPFSAFQTAQQHAARYGKNPQAIVLEGDMTSDHTGYSWTWTFRCDGSVYVLVSVGAQSLHKTSHGLRTWLMGVAPYNRSRL